MASTGALGMAWKTALAAAVFAQLVCPEAWAGDDPRAAVAQLEQDVSHRAIVADALARAKDALERATRLHDLHDNSHAAEADALALEWAAVGRDLARAVDAEVAAADARRRATDTQAQLERTRALVEESIARVGRLETEVARAQRPDGASRVAVESHATEPAPGPARQQPAAGRQAAAPKTPTTTAGSDVRP